jgi:predicted Zn-dependent peptidase
MLSIEGKLVKGVGLEQAEAAVDAELSKLIQDDITQKELTKVQNRTESSIAFEDMSVMSRANSLAFYELLGDVNLFHTDRDHYFQVTAEDIRNYSAVVFDPNNSNTLYYKSITA